MIKQEKKHIMSTIWQAWEYLSNAATDVFSKSLKTHSAHFIVYFDSVLISEPILTNCSTTCTLSLLIYLLTASISTYQLSMQSWSP